MSGQIADAAAPETDEPTAPTPGERRRLAVLQVSVLVVALCGIAYELVIATVSSYLLGDSVYQFSITIGLFMSAMGLGSYVSQWIVRDLVARFVVIEVLVSLAGGLSSTLLFLVFPWYAWYVPTMYSLIILIGVLVGLEIPLLTRILTETRSLRRSIAQVLSLDYLGALIGSLAFPLLLLPHLGLFRASFAFGLLNIGVAALNIAVFRDRLPRARMWAMLTALVVAALVMGMVAAARLTRFAEDRLFAHEVVHREQSRFQRIVVARDQRSGRIRLYLDGHLQFAERDEHRYHEALVHPLLSLPGPRSRILVLGGGDGLVARELLRYPDVERVDLVDIDPAITRLCRTFAPIVRCNGGSLDVPRVHIHHQDAFGFVRRADERWDRVVIDLPDPHNEALSKLYSVQFYTMARRVLRAGGALVSQCSSPYLTREAFWCVAASMEAAGLRVRPYHVTLPTFGMWGFILASEAEPPRDFRFTLPLRSLDGPSMAAAQVFDRDTGPLPDSPVNSLFEPQLYRLYRLGERR